MNPLGFIVNNATNYTYFYQSTMKISKMLRIELSIMPLIKNLWVYAFDYTEPQANTIVKKT